MASIEDSTAPNSLLDSPQMIIEAIEAQGEKQGLNESEILSYIESNYPDLSGDRSTIISETLTKMKESGELIFADDKYLKPDPAPKRGRGRPRKNKEAAPVKKVPVVTGSSRPRGRPPKVRDPLAATPELKKSPASGRGRGRPSKKAETVVPASPAVTAAAADTSGVKRGRGRPPKVRPSATPPAATVGA